jgi:hypothetical protein
MSAPRAAGAAALVAALALWAPAPAAAQVALELGARAGWAFPFGDVQAGEGLSRTFAGALPLQIDAAWRFTPELSAGLYLGYAPARLAAPFRGAFASASGAGLRLGAAGRWRFAPWGGAVPWAGAGAGWEWGLFSVRAGASGTLRLSGPDLHLEGGAEWALPDRRFALGPWVQVAGGQYLTVKAEGAGQASSLSIRRRSVHGWISLGVRGSLGF